MNEQLVIEIKGRMRDKTMNELLDIWKENDRNEWSAEAFEAVSRSLTEKGVTPPPHDKKKAEKTSEKKDAPQYQKIGGWLFLVAAGIILTIILTPITIISNLDAISRFAQQNYVMGYDASTMANFLTVNIIINGFLFVFFTIVVFHFFKKKERTPLLFKFFFKTAVVLAGVEFVFMMVQYQWTFGEWPDPLAVIFLLRVTKLVGYIVASTIWIPYFNLSQRVKGTFVR